MVKKEFYYDSRDGKSKLHGVRYTPDDEDGIRCILQIVHGMAEYIERYEEFARFMTDRGFVVVGEDHLGHGKSVGEKGKYGYFCEQDPATTVVRDVHRLKKITAARYPGIPYVIMGHSMGSFITRNYLCHYGAGVDGAVIMGTGMQPRTVLALSRMAAAAAGKLFGPQKEGKLLDKLAFGLYNRRIANPVTPFDWLSRDEERVRQYLNDPMCGFVFTINGFQTLFELISRLYRPENLERIPKKLPVFLLSGDADPVGGYGKGVKKAYRSLRQAGLENIRMKLYDGGRHELLNETNRRDVMQDIYHWIVKRILCDKAEK